MADEESLEYLTERVKALEAYVVSLEKLEVNSKELIKSDRRVMAAGELAL